MIETSVLIIAIAFTLLVAFTIQALMSLRVTLGKLNRLIDDADRKVIPVVEDSAKVLDSVEGLLKNVDHKLDDLDPVFKTLNTTGSYLDEKMQKNYRRELSVNKKNMDWLDWAMVGIAVLNEVKKRK
jgi:uncharacterized protein YoxC